MDKILCFLKFGEKQYLEGLNRGELFFSNALKFRGIEEELQIKGQGDKLEGSSMIYSQNATMIDNDTQELFMAGFKGNLICHFEPANLLPVYCLFACYEKDCTLNDDGSITFHISDDIQKNIKEHFPKADSVAIIHNPDQFISSVHSSINTECVSDTVKYFNMYGFDVEEGKANDMAYHKYLTQDIPPQKIEGGTRYRFNAKFVYRSLLCKDVFFQNEQEYRFILPKDKITSGTIYKTKIDNKISIVSLQDFFN